MKELTEQQKELLKVAQLSTSELPKTHTELNKMIWDAYEAGTKVSRVELPVIGKRAKAVNKRLNCVGCKYLSKLSGSGYRYCTHKNRGDEVGKVENVNLKQHFCPISI